MTTQKIDLAYFRKVMPRDELENHPHHKHVLFADDCKLTKRFKGNPDHWHFSSVIMRQCFTIEMIGGRIKCISNN